MLYLGIKSIIKRFRASIIAAILMAAIMLVLVILVSTYYKQSVLYRPFADVINSKGIQLSVSGYFGYDEEGYNLNQLTDNLSGVDECIFSLYQSAEIDGAGISGAVYGLEEHAITYEPEMEAGEWLTKAGKHEYPNVVITDSVDGVEVGDVIDLLYYYGEGEMDYVTCYVAGIIKNGAYIYEPLGICSPPIIDEQYRVFDAVNNAFDKGQVDLYISKEDMERSFKTASLGCTFYIKYKQDITDQEIKSNAKYISCLGSSQDMEELYKNSKNYVNKKLLVVIPIVLGVIIFASISLATTSTINTVKELQNYAVYFANGMKWGGIVVIKLVESLIKIVLSALVFGVIVFIINSTKLHNLFEFKYYSVEIIIFICMSIYLVLIQTIIPYLFIRKKNCSDILRKAKI